MARRDEWEDSLDPSDDCLARPANASPRGLCPMETQWYVAAASNASIVTVTSVETGAVLLSGLGGGCELGDGRRLRSGGGSATVRERAVDDELGAGVELVVESRAPGHDP